MSDRISKQPVIINSNGDAVKLRRIPLTGGTFKEEWLQRILEQTPSVLPTAEIAPIFAPLICVAREVHVKTDDNNSGRIDNLYISKDGYLVIVETKLWNNPESRREVVGQILDYAKEVREWDWTTLDNIYRAYHKIKGSLFDAIVAAGYKTAGDQADFIDNVNNNIRTAQFLLMIVGDGIRSGVEKIAEYMNASSPDMMHRLALCELGVYDMGNGRRLVVPQLTTKTKIIERGTIRVDNGNIKLSLAEPTDCKSGTEPSPDKDNIITPDELVSAFTARNKDVSAEQITSFIEDLSDLGLSVKYTAHGASVYCHAPSLQTSIQAFYIPGIAKSGHEDTAALLWFVPARILRRMETLGLSTDAVKKLLDTWRPMLAAEQKTPPYEDFAKFYFLDNKVITNPESRRAFLTALEEFQNAL